MSRENELFNKMLKHYLKSVSEEVPAEKREEHFTIYRTTKYELWALQQEDRDVQVD